VKISKDKGNKNFLISINGLWTSDPDVEALRDSINTWGKVGEVGRVAAWNGSHPILTKEVRDRLGLTEKVPPGGDLFQVLFNELGIVDVAAFRARLIMRNAIRQMKAAYPNDENIRIQVVAHSQGTMVFYRAMLGLTPQEKAMIQFWGNGGEIFIPRDMGLKSAWNTLRDDDVVPLWSNYFNPVRRANNNLGFKFDSANVLLLGKGIPGTNSHTWKTNYQFIYEEKKNLIFDDINAPNRPGPLVLRYPLGIPRFKGLRFNPLDFSNLHIDRGAAAGVLFKNKLKVVYPFNVGMLPDWNPPM
jgi:hypothetical protein